MTAVESAPRQAAKPGELVMLALWFGLVAGLVEVAALAVQHARHPILELSRDFVWMVPLSVVLMTVAAGLLFGALALRWRTPWLTVATIFVCLVIVALELLLYVPRIHDVAVLALALGLGVQLTRTLASRREALVRVATRTVPWLVAGVVLLGGGRRVLRVFHERTALAELPVAAPNLPNVILVTLDAVRAANLSLYGYPRSTSPNIDRLARDGAVFERAMSTAPWTLPSHASMLTGRWHHELSTDFESPLDRTHPTLAAFLATKGYATGAAVANMRYCGYETGLDRGFIHYHDYPVSFRQLLASSKVLRTLLNNFRLRRLIQNDEHLSRKSAGMINDAALDWLGDVQGRPFFLFLNYFDAHEPYLPPPPFDQRFGPGRRQGRLSPLHRWLWEPAMGHANMGDAERQEEIDAYDGAIAYIDSVFGSLLDSLESRGILANTMIIVTADHGEEFAEHKVYEHGYSLYRASVEVPLVIVKPGLVPEGIRVRGPVSLRDIPATVTDLLGFDADAPFPGTSLALEWRDAPISPPPDAPIFAQVNAVTGHPDWFPVSSGTLRSVTYQGLRYIRAGGQSEELYDFNRDPWERNNLIDDGAHQSALGVLRAFVDAMDSTTSRSPR